MNEKGTTSKITPAPACTVEALKAHSLAVSAELMRLGNITKLAAFACEARRVLEGLRQMEDHSGRDALFSSLGEWVEARSAWANMADVSGEVLEDVGQRLSALGMLDAEVNGLSILKNSKTDQGENQ